MYGISRFAKKLNILKYINLTRNYGHYTYGMGNYVHQMYGLSSFAEKLNTQNFVNSAGKVYIIYVQKIWICRENEYPEQRKFSRKLCSLNLRTVWI